MINVLGYWEPLRALIQNAEEHGFIHPKNVHLIQFINGPTDKSQHVDYDWGADVVKFLDQWQRHDWDGFGFDWSRTADGHQVNDNLDQV